MPRILYIVLLMSLIWTTSCKKKYPLEPVIEFETVSKSFMTQNGADSMQLTFSFTDGDDNLGSNTADNIFLMDGRNDQMIASYMLPKYEDNSNQNFRKGEVTLVVYSRCCVYPDSSSCYLNSDYPLDSMTYKLQVQDEDGNFSNIIETSVINLDCEG